MKTKKVLILSLGINTVLLCAMAYMAATTWEPQPQPPLVRYIMTNMPPVSVESLPASTVAQTTP